MVQCKLHSNADKYHYMRLGKFAKNAKFSFDGNTYINSKEKKIFGIFIDNYLLFDSHIKEVRRQASPKLPHYLQD